MKLATAVVLAACALVSGGTSIPQPTEEPAQPTHAQFGGTWIEGILKDGVRQFLGIPYAMPPIGELRWKAPVAAILPETLQATQHGNACHQLGQQVSAFQKAAVLVQTQESEDCLNLSVYAPQLCDGSGADPLPVVIYLNNGYHATGATSIPSNDVSRLVKSQQVIVVTFNTRLGPLGYLAFPEEIGEKQPSGNYGLQDTLLVIEWVRRHIGAFGGDCENITLQGVSSGSMDVMLVLSLMAKPEMKERFGERPFARVIISSITIDTSPLLTREEAVNSFFSLAEAAGCGTADPQQAYQCLSQKSAQELCHVVNERDWKKSWIPVMDEWLGPVANNFAQGKFLKVPTVFTTIAAEGSLFVPRPLREMPIPELYKYHAILSNLEGAPVKARTAQLYPFFSSIDPDVWPLIGDAIVRAPIHKYIKYFVQHGVPTKYQMFGVMDSANTYFKPPFENVAKLGAFHASEYQILLDFQVANLELLPRGPVHRLQELFGNYYRNGEWKSDESINGADVQDDERVKFWNSFPKLPVNLAAFSLRIAKSPYFEAYQANK